MRIRLRNALPLAILTLLAAFAFGQSAPSEIRAGESALERGIRMYDDAALLTAQGHFQRAAEINPRYGDAYFGLARTYYWQGEIAEARRHADEAARLLPADSEVALLRARIAGTEGDLQGAAALYNTVLVREPYNVDARLGLALLDLPSGRTGAVLALLNDLQSRYPENRRLLLSVALLASEIGEDDAARFAMGLALRYYPDLPEVHLLAAELAYRRGDSSDADFHGRNAVALQPSLLPAWEILVATAVEEGDFELAAGRSNQLVSLDPQDARSWYSRGAIFGRAADTTEAYRSLERALSIQSDFELARIALENILLDQTDIEDPLREPYAARYADLSAGYRERYLNRRAEALLRRGLRLNPFDVSMRLALADLYLQQNYRARYVQELRVLDSFTPDFGDVPDLIESYADTLRESVATRWETDQFVLERPQLSLGVYYAEARYLDRLPYESLHIATFVRSLISIEEHIDTSMEHSFRSRATAVADAQRAGLDYALLVRSVGDDRTTAIEYELILARNGRTVVADRIVRRGNDRIASAAEEIRRVVASTLPRSGRIVDRDFDRVLVSLGRNDGMEVGTIVPIIRRNSARPDATGRTWDFAPENVIIEVEIIAIDDLCFEGRFTSRITGTSLAVGDTVPIDPQILERAGEQETEDESARMESPPETDVLLRRLLRIR